MCQCVRTVCYPIDSHSCARAKDDGQWPHHERDLTHHDNDDVDDDGDDDGDDHGDDDGDDFCDDDDGVVVIVIVIVYASGR